MARRDQTLYKDTSDAKIAGVCSGLAKYFDIDTNLVRVGFAAFMLAGGGSVIAYLILALLLDPDPEPVESSAIAPRDGEIVLDAQSSPAASVDQPTPHVEETAVSYGEVLHEGGHHEPHPGA